MPLALHWATLWKHRWFDPGKYCCFTRTMFNRSIRAKPGACWFLDGLQETSQDKKHLFLQAASSWLAGKQISICWVKKNPVEKALPWLLTVVTLNSLFSTVPVFCCQQQLLLVRVLRCRISYSVTKPLIWGFLETALLSTRTTSVWGGDC